MDRLKFGCYKCGAGHDGVCLRGGKRNLRAGIALEYKCLTCNHVGFSIHPDLKEKREREKPPEPIEFEAKLPVVAYDAERCHTRCNAYTYDDDGDPLCQYWVKYLELMLHGSAYLAKRCPECKEAGKRT